MAEPCHCPPEDNIPCCEAFGDCCHLGEVEGCDKCADDTFGFGESENDRRA